MKLNDNKGATGVDITVAIVILMIFVTFITSLFYNLSTSSVRIERKTTATYLAITTIEGLKEIGFEGIKTSDVVDRRLTTVEQITGQNVEAGWKIDVSSGQTIIDIPQGYTVKISIENPRNSENAADDKLGEIAKLVRVEVSYTTGKDIDKDGNKDEEKVQIETLVKKHIETGD
ncbi:MAG: hypothetical protein HFJ55_00295 [Clostridia bacterium]|nr:hypothetical protein [Clostridia bacterium]